MSMAKGFRPVPKGNSASRRASARAATAAAEVPPVNPVAAATAAAENEAKIGFFDRILQGAGNAASDVGSRFAPIGRSLNTPMANMIGGGALGAGLSVLGNVATGELDDKGAGRVALEALGAGALGGIGMNMMGNAARGNALQNKMMNVEADALGRGAIPSIQSIAEEKAGNAVLGNTNRVLQDQNNNFNNYLNRVLPAAADRGAYLDPGANLSGAAAALGGAVALGGLGGLVGGGLSDLAQGAGISGFGSSNTASAKAGMQSTASTAYPANPVGMTNEDMYLASLGYLPMS